MRNSLAVAVAVVVSLCGWLAFTSPVAAAEMVDNPVYQAWAKHKPGTKVVRSEHINRSGGASTQASRPNGEVAGRKTRTVTGKLIEVTPERAILEETTQLGLAGGSRESVSKQTIPAKIEQGPAELPSDASPARFDVTDRKEGEESVKVGEKTYQTKWIQFTVREKGGVATGEIKVWSTPEVPGAVLKIQGDIVNQPGQPPVTSVMMVERVEEGV